YKETIAPNGYVINEETFTFEIKEDGEIIKHIV
ncbi:SpaA isopeptide-forming pilin-related protein, partial [Bacillus sp. CH140a_4T]